MNRAWVRWRYFIWPKLAYWITWTGWKWRIAWWIIQRHPDLCWRKLCFWPLGYSSLSDSLTPAKQQDCNQPGGWVEQYGQGWCGKCKREVNKP
ncbi:MAG: hypothetical protein WC683_04765 [bacterium]